jgi:ribosomal peptide maturation radical SAM protein 1
MEPTAMNESKSKLGSSLAAAEVLLIVPPFGGGDRPCLGIHLLQAAVRRRGLRAQVLYANLAFAAEIGETAYQAICSLPVSWLLGERLFARAAYGVPPLGHDRCRHAFDELARYRAAGYDFITLQPEALGPLEELACQWVQEVAEAVTSARYPIVGCGTTFEQTATAIALLNAIKDRRPGTVTVLGGANAEGAMAEGLLSLSDRVDYVFSGESDDTFPAFVEAILQGQPPVERVLRGKYCINLDSLPTPDYTDYYQQLSFFLPESETVRSGRCYLSFETSRGCWWGEKNRCSFCGLSGEAVSFREKSAQRVIEELRLLTREHPTNKVAIHDNVMPHAYFHTLLPQLPAELPGIELSCELRSNLTLGQVRALATAGVTQFQAGIESLSPGLLRLMRKGVSAASNIALLRYCRALGVDVRWNLLCGLPNDEAAFYSEILALLPLIRHLRPPSALNAFVLSRFSPYFERPAEYGIARIHAIPAYRDVLPLNVDPDQIAYHFTADFRSGALAHPDLLRRLAAEVVGWRRLWSASRGVKPELSISRQGKEFLLVDSRSPEGTSERRSLTPEQVAVLLTKNRLNDKRADLKWALDAKLLLELDGHAVPLATSEPEILASFEANGSLAMEGDGSGSHAR